MAQTVVAERRRSHHPVIDQVEQARLITELRNAMLALRSHVNGRRDQRAQQLHKDVQQRKNKAPETIGLLLTEAFNERAPLKDVERICEVISSFFRAKRRGTVRGLRALSPLETAVEGRLNCHQVAIDQGDLSAPTLIAFLDDLDRYVAIIEEMKAAALLELYGPKEVRS